MSQMTHRAGRAPRDQFAFAFVLIAVGIAGLVSQVWHFTGDVGGWIVLLIGLGLLGGFVFIRQFGYLIPAGILTGLGAGIIVSQSFTFPTGEGEGGAVVLGLGLGFLSVWAISAAMHLERHHWWPLIPGGILSVVGGALLIGGTAIDMLDYWGAAVVVIGLFILWRAWTERSDEPVDGGAGR
jgi:hypothetical protein